MFGFQGGESEQAVSRKRGYMKEAQQRWPFLTNYDASTIKNPIQLKTMVKDRSGRPQAEVAAEVEAWMAGKSF
jgi:hypothetical protein